MPGGSSLRGEAVSDPDLGEEKARLGGVRLELMAELRHIDAQIMAVLEVVRSPDLFEKLPVGVSTMPACFTRTVSRRYSMGVRCTGRSSRS